MDQRRHAYTVEKELSCEQSTVLPQLQLLAARLDVHVEHRCSLRFGAGQTDSLW